MKKNKCPKWLAILWKGEIVKINDKGQIYEIKKAKVFKTDSSGWTREVLDGVAPQTRNKKKGKRSK